MCEPALAAVQDFAMEYCCNAGRTEFVGYSVFGNDSHSAFSGGIVAPEAVLRAILVSQLGDSRLLEAVKEAVRAFVEEEIAPHYDGYLGVDMMLYDDGGVVRLNPCIEVNLRMTMGAVTALFACRFLAEGVRARFEVVQSDAETMRRLAEENPPLIEDGKYCGGVLMLTPIYRDARYFAFVRGKR